MTIQIKCIKATWKEDRVMNLKQYRTITKWWLKTIRRQHRVRNQKQINRFKSSVRKAKDQNDEMDRKGNFT